MERTCRVVPGYRNQASDGRFALGANPPPEDDSRMRQFAYNLPTQSPIRQNKAKAREERRIWPAIPQP